MKKLMFAAVAAAVTTGAYALPTVYDYKASVKYMDLKKVSVNAKWAGFQGQVYQKVQKTTSLKGYLIMDTDGVTSLTLRGEAYDSTRCADYGRNRGFLVVLNPKAPARVKQAKVLPAVLDAKFYDKNFKEARSSTGLAEGILYVGGDSIKGVRPHIDDFNYASRPECDGLKAREQDFWTETLPAANTAGMVAYSDYVWTSIYLFGEMNGPNWYTNGRDPEERLIPFWNFEQAWDDNLPDLLKRNVLTVAGTTGTAAAFTDVNGDGNPDNGDIWNYYHDTWMNGTGFGKYFIPADKINNAGDVCCGLQASQTITTYEPVLQTLSGNLKGGLFLCTENGILATDNNERNAGYNFFTWRLTDDVWMHRWEDQFVSYRLHDANHHAAQNASYYMSGDAWQNDLWQDGAVDQATTDVLFGSWSIKYNSKFFSAKNPVWTALTNQEKLDIADVDTSNATAPFVAQELVANTDVLLGAIKGAALKLGVRNAFCDGTEIYEYSSQNRFGIPVITPQFAAYYNLANYQLVP